MLAGPKVAQIMQFGAHGTTFGGNPMAAAVARVELRKLSSADVQANVQRQSVVLWKALESLGAELGLFSQIRGRGLMLGAVLAESYRGNAGDILDFAAAHGLLMLQAGPDVLRFVPPLNITDKELSDGLTRLRAALKAFVDR
jgi:acetylornithine/N-succinyldiaminopimelate aminotransferase